MKYNKLMKKFNIFALSFLLILVLFNFQIVKIAGNSMSPTLKSGSFVVADKHIHKLFQIQKNDILLLEVDKKEVVKKIVGFPGEKIEVEGQEVTLSKNEIYVLGQNLPESIDSREYGPLKTSQIRGKIVLIF
jgi:signal peptidase I